MNDLNALKQIAIDEANAIDFNWELIDNNLSYRVNLEQTFTHVTESLPTLESLYAKLSSGKSVLTGEDTALSSDEITEYLIQTEEALAEAYMLQELNLRYTLIKSVTELGKGNPY